MPLTQNKRAMHIHNSGAEYHNIVLAYQPYASGKLHLLPQICCHFYAELVSSFYVIAAGSLDL